MPWYSYLDFQRVSVIRTWCEVSVNFGSTAEGPTVRDFVIKPEAVPVARSIWAAGHPTLKRVKLRDLLHQMPRHGILHSSQEESVQKHRTRERTYSVWVWHITGNMHSRKSILQETEKN